MSNVKRGFVIFIGANWMCDTAVAQPVALTLDYPPASLRAGEQGAVKFRVALNRSGEPTKCEIVESSGYPRLDQATCRQIKASGRFKPAVGEDGRAMTSEYTGVLRWKLPAPPLPTPPDSASE